MVAPPPSGPLVWRYEVTVTPALDLDVDAMIQGPTEGPLRIDEDAAPFFVPHAFGAAGHAKAPASPVDPQTIEASIRLGGADAKNPTPDWRNACTWGCRVHYTVKMRNAARAVHDTGVALESGGAVFAPPSTWLLRPGTVPAAGRYRFHVNTPIDTVFVSGVRPAAGVDVPGTYEADVRALEDASIAAFGPLRVQKLDEAGLVLAIAARGEPVPETAIARWVRGSAAALTAYLHRPPATYGAVFVTPGTSDSTRGLTLGGGGASVLIRLATDETDAKLADDWVATHELVHVALPDLGQAHAWLAEGLASYVEPIARARAGQLTPEKVWGDLVEGAPQGLPEAGDRGLEFTHTWGRVYWGGAVFCLQADVQIRVRTDGKRGLDDALRAVAATGANVETQWTIERFLEIGDRATGTNVLHELFAKLALAPGPVDLDDLWRKLGVRRAGASVAFDDHAPWAAIRVAMTRVER
jgi:hypothetical protein